jgi:hypothetical protein
VRHVHLLDNLNYFRRIEPALNVTAGSVYNCSTLDNTFQSPCKRPTRERAPHKQLSTPSANKASISVRAQYSCGAVITEAGNQPNVVGLVYIAAFAPDAGESLLDVGQAFPAPPGVANAAPDSDGYIWINPKKFHESFCQDLTPDEALVMAVTQKAPVGSTFGDKVTVPAWKSKPSWYQISSEDRMIAPANEKRMAERMEAKRIITLAAGHASLASAPNPVSALIDEAAKAGSA